MVCRHVCLPPLCAVSSATTGVAQAFDRHTHTHISTHSHAHIHTLSLPNKATSKKQHTQAPWWRAVHSI
jgi:hypothetical protein